MKKEKHKNIDEVFKKVLQDPDNERGFDQQDWNALQNMLDGEKKSRKIIYWPRLLSVAAAILLIALGWWYLAPQTVQKANDAEPMVTKQPKGISTPQSVPIVPVPIAPQLLTGEAKRHKDSVTPISPAYNRPQTISPNDLAANTPKPNESQNIRDIKQVETAQNNNLVNVLGNSAVSGLPADSGDRATPDNLLAVTSTPDDEKSPKESWLKKPQLAISVMASADMNGVNSFSSTGTGQNFGLLFSAQFNKFTISTGVHYSYKPYAMAFSAYSPNSAYKFGYTPASVVADCRMLDIPLNIDYQLFSKNRNTISIGTGISSYLMLQENYTYNYNNGTSRLTTYSVNSPGQYLFSAVNFQANYRRQINSKLGINVMPYVKVPLANVGYSQVRLQTAGVAIGFNWNFNTLPKPR